MFILPSLLWPLLALAADAPWNLRNQVRYRLLPYQIDCFSGSISHEVHLNVDNNELQLQVNPQNGLLTAHSTGPALLFVLRGGKQQVMPLVPIEPDCEFIPIDVLEVNDFQLEPADTLLVAMPLDNQMSIIPFNPLTADNLFNLEESAVDLASALRNVLSASPDLAENFAILLMTAGKGNNPDLPVVVSYGTLEICSLADFEAAELKEVYQVNRRDSLEDAEYEADYSSTPGANGYAPLAPKTAKTSKGKMGKKDNDCCLIS